MINLPAPDDYARWLSSLKAEIQGARARAALAVNQELVRLYHRIGMEILDRQRRLAWGSKVIERVSCDLREAFPEMRGLSASNLKYMKVFAEMCPTLRIGQQAADQLPWFHLVTLLTKVANQPAREWYAVRAVEHGWSRATLEAHIQTQLHLRQGAAVTNFEQRLPPTNARLAVEALKDPYNFDMLGLGEEAQERDIEDALVRHIRHVLREMGPWFAFVDRQFRIEVDGDEYFIDLLFYHTRLKCYVVVELKAGVFKPDHAGQLNFYLAAMDAQIKAPDDHPTIGLLLCKSKKRLTAEYALSGIAKPMGVAEYHLVRALPEPLDTKLPTIEALEEEMNTALLQGEEREEDDMRQAAVPPSVIWKPMASNWTLVPIGSLARFSSGRGISIAGLHAQSSQFSVPVYDGNGIAGYAASPNVNGPTVIVGRVGQRCGEVHFADGPVWVTDNALYPTHLLRALDMQFFGLALRAAGLNDLKNRNDLPLLTQSILHGVRIAWTADLVEQRAVAAALSDVDALLGSFDRLIAKKRELLEATTTALVMGKARLSGFDGRWQQRRLGQVANVKTGSRNNEDKSEGGAYPLFARSQTVERIDSYSYDCEAVLVPGEGGIGSIVHYVNGKFDCHQRVYKISAFDDATCGKFIYYVIKTGFHKQPTRNSVKATVDSLRLPTFLEFQYLAPSREEQVAIAAVLSDMDAEIAALEQRRDKTRFLKQAMMQELLTGRTRLV